MRLLASGDLKLLELSNDNHLLSLVRCFDWVFSINLLTSAEDNTLCEDGGQHFLCACGEVSLTAHIVVRYRTQSYRML